MFAVFGPVIMQAAATALGNFARGRSPSVRERSEAMAADLTRAETFVEHGTPFTRVDAESPLASKRPRSVSPRVVGGTREDAAGPVFGKPVGGAFHEDISANLDDHVLPGNEFFGVPPQVTFLAAEEHEEASSSVGQNFW